MANLPSERRPVAIVGASTFLGKELKKVLEGRNFPASEIELFDEEASAVGLLTEAGGEATIVRGLQEEDFHGMSTVFVVSSGSGASRSAQAAADSGAAVIDLNPHARLVPHSQVRIPAITEIFPESSSSPISGAEIGVRNSHSSASAVVRVPSAPVIIACTLLAALRKFTPLLAAITFFPPVSEHGQAGIDELETQTSRLLAFQLIAQPVFGAQVAFNLLSRYGGESVHHLAESRDSAAREIAAYIAGRTITPAIQFIQAPVFYGYAFSALVDFGSPPNYGAIAAALDDVGIKVASVDQPGPNNISVADDSAIHVAAPVADPNVPSAMWLWGAADHFRLVADNAVRVAETIFAG